MTLKTIVALGLLVLGLGLAVVLLVLRPLLIRHIETHGRDGL